MNSAVVESHSNVAKGAPLGWGTRESCQIIVFQSDEVCEVSYADRKGKYQSQKGIVLPKL